MPILEKAGWSEIELNALLHIDRDRSSSQDLSLIHI